MKSVEEFRNKELYKNMTRSEKVKYVWGYYKFHICIPIVLVIIVGSFIYSYINQKESIFNLTFTSTVATQESIDKLKEIITDELVGEGNTKQEIVIQTLNVKEESELGMAEIQKLVAQVSTNEINVMIMDKETYLNYCNQDFFVDLTEIGDKIHIDNLKGKLLDDKGEVSESTAYGIDLSDNSFLKDNNISAEGQILGVVVGGKTTENTYKFINENIAN